MRCVDIWMRLPHYTSIEFNSAFTLGTEIGKLLVLKKKVSLWNWAMDTGQTAWKFKMRIMSIENQFRPACTCMPLRDDPQIVDLLSIISTSIKFSRTSTNGAGQGNCLFSNL